MRLKSPAIRHMIRCLIPLLAVFAFAAAPAVQASNSTMGELVNMIGDGSYKGVTSLLVAKDGKIVEEYYFADGGPQVLNDTGAMTATLTGLAVGAAIYQGALENEGERVFQFFGDRAPHANMAPAKRAITVKDLLTMSSALACDDTGTDGASQKAAMRAHESATEYVLGLPVQQGYSRDADGLGAFHYCSACHRRA